MTEDDTTDNLLTQERDSEFDIPNLYGGITIWDHLLKEFEESLIGLGREVFPKTDDRVGPEYRYRYAVAEKFLEIKRENKLEGTQGFCLADQRRLRDAMETVAKAEDVTRERIRQACVQPYEGTGQNEKTDQFLEDLIELEGRLIAWREQNQE